MEQLTEAVLELAVAVTFGLAGVAAMLLLGILARLIK